MQVYWQSQLAKQQSSIPLGWAAFLRLFKVLEVNQTKVLSIMGRLIFSHPTNKVLKNLQLLARKVFQNLDDPARNSYQEQCTNLFQHVFNFQNLCSQIMVNVSVAHKYRIFQYICDTLPLFGTGDMSEIFWFRDRDAKV